MARVIFVAGRSWRRFGRLGRAELGSGGLGAVQLAVLPLGSGVTGGLWGLWGRIGSHGAPSGLGGFGHELTQGGNSLLLLEFGGSEGKRGLQCWWDLSSFGRIVIAMRGSVGIVSAPEASQSPLLPWVWGQDSCVWKGRWWDYAVVAAFLKNKVFCFCGAGGKGHPCEFLFQQKSVQMGDGCRTAVRSVLPPSSPLHCYFQQCYLVCPWVWHSGEGGWHLSQEFLILPLLLDMPLLLPCSGMPFLLFVPCLLPASSCLGMILLASPLARKPSLCCPVPKLVPHVLLLLSLKRPAQCWSSCFVQ